MEDALHPPDKLILHEEEFRADLLASYHDEPYFRLLHNMTERETPKLPEEYALCRTSLRELASHINRCYGSIGFTVDAYRSYFTHTTYAPILWLTIADQRTSDIVASRIGETDREPREGTLEWIQFSQKHRRSGLGRCIVMEPLRRMRGHMDFATVSGTCDSSWHPEDLYRSCGLHGTDEWHVPRRTAQREL